MRRPTPDMSSFPSTPADRRTARLAKSLVYFTGKSCPKGHLVCRYTSNGACTECVGTAIQPEARTFVAKKTCRKCGAKYHKKCRACRVRLGRRWAAKNREYFAERQRERTRGCAEEVHLLKERTPCADCGDLFPWYVTEYDHVEGRGPEDATVASLVRGANMERVLAEIAKCDLVCSNCHNVRTHFRAVAAGQRRDYAVPSL